MFLILNFPVIIHETLRKKMARSEMDWQYLYITFKPVF